ncbi:HNH endonuclease [bacterium]|nr:HNH endonuclease [bacterium]
MSRKINDLTGKIFNKLTVLEKLDERINNSIAWRCKCVCGNEKIVNSIALIHGFTKSCKSCKNSLTKKDTPIGKEFNHLTILEDVEYYIGNNGRKFRQVKCLCDCGKEKIVQLRRVLSGKVKSCGCVFKKFIAKKDLMTTTLKHWNVIKREPKDTYLCTCKKCKAVVIFNHKSLIKDKQCTCYKKQHKKTVINKHSKEMFGDLLITKNIKNGLYECECYCGNTITTDYYKLKSGKVKDCGCNKKLKYKKLNEGMNFINKKFGRLEVLSRCVLRYGRYKKSGITPFWLCLCACGKTKIVSTHGLIGSNTRSCGCLQFEIAYQGIHFGAIRQRKYNKLRSKKKYKDWRLAVFKRDTNTCQICNNYFETDNLRAHHLLAFSKYKDLRYEKDNGVTMCIDCHNTFHNIHTSTDFTIDNYIEYSNTIK